MKKILFIVIIIAIAGFAWFTFMAGPVTSVDVPESVSVQPGQSVTAIANVLKEKGLIRSPFFFKMYVRFKGVQAKLQAGDFMLSPAQSAGEIIEILTSGKTQDIIVTIPEGLTVADIDALVASKGLAQAGDILNCAYTCDFSAYSFIAKRNVGSREDGYGSKLEGYLFPETYFVSRSDFKPENFLKQMLDTFSERVIIKYADDIKTSGRTLPQIVTMASLIEEESRTEHERPIVSGILWKRYDAPMVLGVDATVRYFRLKTTSAITRQDLEAESPYNTRKNRGLPPTPIASASEQSIIAALHPQASEYWFYLHDAEGKIHYAETNDDHNLNKQQFLR